MTARPQGEWRALEPADAAELLRGYGRPWWVAGGWAVDLFLGRRTREHGDVDVLVLRHDQERLRAHFAGWELHVAHEGVLELWDGARLELPRHALWARRDEAGPWELELLLAESQDGLWRYRRAPEVAVPLERVGLDRDGIPYVAPELALLFKAKGPRAQDDADLRAVLPELGPERRAWLRATLAVRDPAHPWLPLLA